jgi:hypothetical protein
MGTAEDLANAVLFLDSDESKCITCIELTVDGGILAGAAANQRSKMMKATIRKATIEEALAIFTAEKEIAATPGYFYSQPNELSEQNVIKTIKFLTESRKGICLVAERDG